MSRGGRDDGRANKAATFPARLERLGQPARSASPSAAGNAVVNPATRPNEFVKPVVAPSTKLLRPQRLLHEAAVDQARQSAPQGLGLDSQRVRQAMLQRLQQLGVKDHRVLNAMGNVPRHLFVDTALANQAYEDTSLPIGLGQTISKPSIVARMIELLCTRPDAVPGAPKPLGTVLEIGTGCGYQAAVLVQLARQVVSIERLRGLHDKARLNLHMQHMRGLRLVLADGMLGYPGLAPFDTIIAAAGGQELPQAWLDQLAVGGRLVAPVHAPGAGPQKLVVVDRIEDGTLLHKVHESVHFVPLKSGLD